MPRMNEVARTPSVDDRHRDRAMDQVWRSAEVHLALIDDPETDPRVRAFATDVVIAALSRQPPERTLARTFEVLHHLVDRDDGSFGDLLLGVPDLATSNMRVALTRLGARAVLRANRATVALMVTSLRCLRVPIPLEWMRRLMELTPDDQLSDEFVYTLFDWSSTPEGEAAHGMLLAHRPALEAPWSRVCEELADEEPMGAQKCCRE